METPVIRPEERLQGFLVGMVVGHSIGLGLKEQTVSMSRLRESASDPAVVVSLPELSPDLRFQMALGERLLAGEGLERLWLQGLFLDTYQEAERHLGPQTERVLDRLRTAKAEEDPDAWAFAEDVWEASNRQAAGSGAFRRIPLLVLRGLADPRGMEKDILAVSSMTHADPRSLGGALAFARLSLALLRGRWRSAAETGVLLVGLAPQIAQAFQAAALLPASSLSTSGYAVTLLQVAYYGLLKASDLAHGLLDLLRRDEALIGLGTVAGAWFGAKFGLSAIPKAWREAAPAAGTWLEIAKHLPHPPLRSLGTPETAIQ